MRITNHRRSSISSSDGHSSRPNSSRRSLHNINYLHNANNITNNPRNLRLITMSSHSSTNSSTGTQNTGTGSHTSSQYRRMILQRPNQKNRTTQNKQEKERYKRKISDVSKGKRPSPDNHNNSYMKLSSDNTYLLTDDYHIRHATRHKRTSIRNLLNSQRISNSLGRVSVNHQRIINRPTPVNNEGRRVNHTLPRLRQGKSQH